MLLNLKESKTNKENIKRIPCLCTKCKQLVGYVTEPYMYTDLLCLSCENMNEWNKLKMNDDVMDIEK